MPRTNFIPLADRILVRLDIHDGRTRSGLFVPPTAQHSMTGTIEAVGKGVKDKALVPGVKVHFTRFAGAVGDEIADGVLCVQEAQLAGYFDPTAPKLKLRKRA